MPEKDSTTLQDFVTATGCEWQETNGLGGWSSSTLIGCHTRRYHGLLVAATVPPSERMVLVSKLDETIVTATGRFELGTNNYDNTIHPQGYQYMIGFSKTFFPEFFYEAGAVQLKKTICMVQGENTVLVLYKVIKAANPFTMELLPLLAVRDYHSLVHANDAVNREACFQNDVFTTKSYPGTPTIYIKIPGARFTAAPNWFYNFNYSIEQYRGLSFAEDLFSHGMFSVQLKEGDTLGIIVSTEDPAGKDAHALLRSEEKRKNELLNRSDKDETVQQLVLAADQFIVNRGEGLKTVIAGYHWFTDWGRDTMISLPGLSLSTGRYEDARKIISAFAGSVSQGMLPNRFTDYGGAPEYNNVDGTLWYFIAVYKYLLAANDTAFVLQEILPVLKDIIDWHYKGTRFHIRVTDDGLLYAGEEGQQLTWMDAKVDDWVVTPRRGKPVEIQALWYNALRIFAELLQLNNQYDEAANILHDAAKAKQSFTDLFWYAGGNHLFDNIDEHGNFDSSLRPNQLFAISLPFSLIEGEQAQAVLQIVKEQLYTPVGLKTLPAGDSNYIPVYGGDQWHRDAAYHQGTVWSWLLGPYVDAIIKLEAESGKAMARVVIENFKYHLNEACIGSVSEIFDADPPHRPRGCIAQAWSVAEVLRVIKEYGLND